MKILQLTKKNETPNLYTHVTEYEESWRHRGVEKNTWKGFDPEVDNEPTYVSCDFSFGKSKSNLIVFTSNDGNIEILKEWDIQFRDTILQKKWNLKKMLKKTGKIKNKYNKPENEWIMKFLNHNKGAKWYRCSRNE